MEVILLERIAKLGQMGDVVRVKDGFARNFLLPKGKAMRATATNRTKFEGMKVDLQATSLVAKGEADKVASKLDGQKFTVLRQASETGQLYGSVSPRDLAQIMTEGGFKVDRNQIALQYLERVGLADWADHLPSEMSGGQKQRVAIARALIGKPRLILADEPTGALDSETSFQIMDLLSEIHRTGITVLVVTHDAEVAARTQRTIRLRDGKVMGEHEPALHPSASNPNLVVAP